jgi:hypothetical protein
MTDEIRWVIVAFAILLVAIGTSGVTVLYDIKLAIKDKKPTNISEYLKIQDDKIATQSAVIEKYRERTVELEKQVSEDYETVYYMGEYLTKDEKKKFWDMWEVEICPSYHKDWYCKGDS